MIFVMLGGIIRTADDHLLTDWFYYIRELIADYVDNEAKPMGGPGSEVQIEESFFGGKRKYNRSRALANDKFERVGRMRSKTSLTARRRGSTSRKPTKRNNFGRKVVNRFGWVFGLVWVQPNGTRERRFFRVEKRDRATLRPIIEKHVAGGTVIVSAIWRAYSDLETWTPAMVDLLTSIELSITAEITSTLLLARTRSELSPCWHTGLPSQIKGEISWCCNYSYVLR
uniref:ISXO2-like transposase domain-containing protein n=1 Tax=Plectus sambesii TaxID=2011161 RepID=A0A914WLE9_9BILA